MLEHWLSLTGALHQSALCQLDVGRVCGATCFAPSAEGATTPETLRQKDRYRY
jgi:hypothetical protein